MHVRSIMAKNVWSFGEPGVSLAPDGRHTVLIGRNNSGKSKVLAALRWFASNPNLFGGNGIELDPEVYHETVAGEAAARPELLAGITLGPEAIALVLSRLKHALSDGGAYGLAQQYLQPVVRAGLRPAGLRPASRDRSRPVRPRSGDRLHPGRPAGAVRPDVRTFAAELEHVPPADHRPAPSRGRRRADQVRRRVANAPGPGATASRTSSSTSTRGATPTRRKSTCGGGSSESSSCSGGRCSARTSSCGRTTRATASACCPAAGTCRSTRWATACSTS